MSYSFLGASLPMLSLEGQPPMTVEEFAGYCGQHLRPKDFAVLRRLLDDNVEPGDGEFASAWKDLDTELRNAVAAERAALRGADAAPHTREEGAHFDSYVLKGVAEAFAGKNPRQRELALDRLRWGIIEELQGLDPFSAEAIFAYGLKLKIAARWAAMDRERGRGILEETAGRLAAAGTAPATER